MYFLSRSSNVVFRDGDVVTKTSSDIPKILAEYKHYYACNPKMQSYMAKPYGLAINSKKSASYKMEFLGNDSVGDLLVKDKISKNKMLLVMQQVSEFYNSGKISSTMLDYESVINDTVFKLEDRAKITSMHNFEFAEKMYKLLERINSGFHNEYKNSKIYLKESHGDMHFSNMILNGTKLYLIDPKGVDFLWLDPAYDLAKLSHSILGGYDFIINDVDFKLNRDAQGSLLEIIKESAVSYEQVRLNEASLFASMTPLHLEETGHVDKFLNQSDKILSELGY